MDRKGTGREGEEEHEVKERMEESGAEVFGEREKMRGRHLIVVGS